MTALRAGMKVVCIDDVFKGTGYGDEALPVKGGVYTIRETVSRNGAPHVLLVEIRNPVRLYRDGEIYSAESSWKAARFRPVKTTSIEVFKAMLAPEPNAPKRTKVRGPHKEEV